MVYGLTYWIKSILLVSLAFGLVGGMTAWGYFFFENREMCPCAPAGMEDGEGLTVAQPYSSDLLTRRSLTFGGAGALIGVVVGIAIAAPRARRFNAVSRE